MSKRELIRQWRSKPENNELFDILKSTANPENFNNNN